jgi:hypothetical protein
MRLGGRCFAASFFPPLVLGDFDTASPPLNGISTFQFRRLSVSGLASQNLPGEYPGRLVNRMNKIVDPNLDTRRKLHASYILNDYLEGLD